jgi:hypothetical protein
MKVENIGSVIAERQLDGRENGRPCKVVVRFGKPVQDQGDGSWYCPYSVATENGERLFYAAGVDSLQALRIAISMVGSELSTLYSHLELTWGGEGDLGFSSQL